MADIITAEGIQIPSLTEDLAAISAEQRATIDPLLDTDPESPVGEIDAPLVGNERDAWEGIQVAFDAFNPDACEGFLLDAVCALTGTFRDQATKSRFEQTIDPAASGYKLTVNLNSSTTLAAGVIIQQEGSTVRFITTENVVSTTASNYLVAAECTVTGPIACNAGTLTIIVTPQVGLNSVTNTTDAILGTNVESDASLRLKREEELRATGSGTTAAIAAKLRQLRVSGVSVIKQVKAVENTSDSYDIMGRPPHSIEALVYDSFPPEAPDDAVAQVIWDNKPAGITAYGLNCFGTAIDADGDPQRVPFTRPVQTDIKYNLEFTYNAKTYPGDTAAKAAIKAKFDLVVGFNSAFVRWDDYIADLKAIGMLDITTFQLGFVGSGFASSFTNLALNIRQRGALDTSNITISSSPGTP